MSQRIAVIVADLAIGGVQRSAISIAHMLADQHEVTVIAPAPTPILRPSGGVGLVAGNEGDGRDVRARIERQRWLGRALHEVRPTVAIALTPGPATMTLTSVLSSGVRRPKVVFADRNDFRVKVDRRSVRAARSIAYLLSDAVVVQTAALASAVADRKGSRAIYVIPNALSRSFVDGRAPGVQPHQKRALFVGRLVPQKRAEDAIAAFATVAREHPEWVLDIVGDGPCRDDLERLAQRLRVGDRVLFHGEHTDPSPVYAAASVLMLTSLHEGFPNVLIEAMAFGVPVISYDCPSGPAEIVTDGVDGYLVPSGDVAAMAGHLGRLMGSPEDVRRMGAAGVEAVASFTEENVKARWNDLVGDLTSRRRRRVS